ncbi:MAG: 3-dehydroquinate synthase family protein [Bacteroidales bacterium]|nr:3-dehydroquinate synthase family protein [Bacteroidales bacterium]
MTLHQKQKKNDGTGVPTGELSFVASENMLAAALSKYIGETEKYLLLADTNTAKHCLPIIKNSPLSIPEAHIITIEAGEGSKNTGNLNFVWTRLQQAGAGRSTTLINLGGGMITDLGGFAASTYKRGIPFINIPTSLLGMADAAIGGKTGINLGQVKNQAGSFAHPEAVVIWPGFLYTLPIEDLLSGYAEMIKTALVSDKSLFAKIANIDPGSTERNKFIGNISGTLLREVAVIKKNICDTDFFDHGQRQCLNFGHSIGHAIEAMYLKWQQPLPHGYAIACGMICEAYLSEALAGLSHDDCERVQGLLTAIFPGIALQTKDLEEIIGLIRQDKKNTGGKIQMSLLQAIGQCTAGITCPEQLIRNSLIRYIELG